MFKLTDAADLEKAGSSLANYFVKQIDELSKSFAHQSALAGHHAAMKASHAEQADCMKAHHEGVADEDVHKGIFAKSHAHHAKMASHHEECAKTHGAYAESLKSQMDHMKAIASDWGATVKADGSTTMTPTDLTKAGTVEQKFQVVTDALVTKALETITTSPKVAELLEGAALEHINKLIGEKIGAKLMPTPVTAINPNPAAGLTAVPRSGAKTVEPSKVPLEFQKLVAVEADDE
jgi:hypothetical protein